MFSASLGDRFEDLDKRAGNRVVRVIEVGTDWRGLPKYRVQVEVAELAPHTAGRRRWVKASTLATKYRKLSH